MTISSSRRSYESSTKGAIVYGVALFAGVTLTMLALFQVLQGIAAIAADDIYVRGVNYTYEMDVTTWGWIHLVIGLIGIATGVGIIMGMTWGRVAGVVIAAISAISNFAFVPYYPVWSLLIIAFNILVIWALCTQVANESSATT